MLVRILILLSIGSSIAFIFLQYQNPGSLAARAASYLMTFAVLIAGGLTFGSAALRTKEKPLRLVWRWISIAAFVWSLSAVLEFFESRLGEPSYGTIADSFWATGYLFLLIAMIKAIRTIPGWKTWRCTLICGIWMLIAVLVFFFTILPIIPKVDRKILVLIGLCFYWFDVLLVASGILASFATTNPAPSAFRFLLISFLILFICYITISLFFLQVTPHAFWLNLAFAAAYWMMYFAGKSVPDLSTRHDSPLM